MLTFIPSICLLPLQEIGKCHFEKILWDKKAEGKKSTWAQEGHFSVSFLPSSREKMLSASQKKTHSTFSVFLILSFHSSMDWRGQKSPQYTVPFRCGRFRSDIIRLWFHKVSPYKSRSGPNANLSSLQKFDSSADNSLQHSHTPGSFLKRLTLACT
jgi:hypothetical protein